MDFNAAKAYIDYKRNYLDFLIERTIGGRPEEGEENRWTAIKRQLMETWNSDDPGTGLFAKPILEGLFPYPDCGRSFENLTESNVLDPRMRDYMDAGLVAGDYNLYTHQLESIERVNEGRNIIVSSGTGSGKTECFLYPMLNRLLRDEDENSLRQPGVRILMIYPMNALVKDQLKRIVELLKGQSIIKVGMYTSQTPNSGVHDEWAIDKDRTINRTQPIAYECCRASRNDIRMNPPHILITNYSMLEYMMLRHSDHDIFDTNKLRAIVLDEAHLYTGNLANDISMLIRRTLLRMNKRRDDIRFYATSATIGDGTPASLQNAAAGLFGVDHESVAAITGDRDFPNVDDDSQNEIIDESGSLSEEDKKQLIVLRKELVKRGNHLPVTLDDVALLGKALGACVTYRKTQDGKPSPYLPFKLHCFVDSPRYFYSDMNICDGAPLGYLSRKKYIGDVEGLQVFTTDQSRKDIYFKGRVHHIADELSDAWYLFNDDTDGDEILNGNKASVCRDDDDNRVVIFRLRANNGFDDACLGFSLERSGACWKIVRGTEDAKGMFVFATRNGQGDDESVGPDVPQFEENEEAIWRSAIGDTLKVFGLGRHSKDEGVDVDDLADDEADDDSQTASYRSGHMLMPLGLVIESLRAQLSMELLFPNLSDAKMKSGETLEQYGGRLRELPWNGRQALVFADSRRGAANAALLMQDKHQREYIKSCIYRVLGNADAEGKSISSMVTSIYNSPELFNQIVLPQWLLDQNNINIADCKEKMLKGLIINELMRNPSERSLEGCGAIRCTAKVFDCSLNGQQALRANLPEGCWNRGGSLEQALQALALELRGKRFVYIRDWSGIEIQEENYVLRAYYHGLSFLGTRYHKKEQQEQGAHLEARRRNNGRLIHIYRRNENDNSPFVGLSLHVRRDGNGVNLAKVVRDAFGVGENDVEQIGQNLVEYIGTIARCYGDMDDVDAPQQILFVKDPQGRIAVNADAFRFMRCNGDNAVNTFDYRQNTGEKQDDYPGCDKVWEGLRVPEHSAQLDVKKLSKIEELFRRQEINVISCTPTMEVGVDIGGLSVVVLQGVPPERANYFQRVGRAGRRDQHSALALTMTGKGGNTDAVFESPERIFTASNVYREADIIRQSSREQVKKHIFQFIVGCAFRNAGVGRGRQTENPIKAWAKVGNFLSQRNILEKYLEWIGDDEIDENDPTREVLDQLALDGAFCDNVGDLDDQQRIQYVTLVSNTSCSDLSLNDACVELRGKLQQCKLEFNNVMSMLVREASQLENGTDEQQRRYRALKRQFFLLYKEELIKYLSHKRIIPAFGFPIDVLSFAAGDNTSVERDAATAIREFVPGSSITIGHAKYRIDALARNYFSDANGSYSEFYLWFCKGCRGRFITETQQVEECPVCHRRRRDAVGLQNEEDQLNAEENNAEGNAGGEGVGMKFHRYIIPANYVSFQPGARDAVVTTSGFVSSRNDEVLIVDNPATALNLRWSTQQCPAPMSFDVISSASKKVHSLTYNSGNGNGFILNATTGQILAKPRATEQVNGIVARWRGADDQCNIQGAGDGPGIDLAFKSQVGALVIGVPCYDGAEDMLKQSISVRKLLSMAFLKVAADMLRVDARQLKTDYKYVWRDGNSYTALLCIYDTSGNDNYLIELHDRKNELRDTVLSIFNQDRTPDQVRDAVYCYSNSFGFADMTDSDIRRLQNWIGNNRQKLVQGEYAGIRGCDGQIHRVNHLAVIADPLAGLGPANRVMILTKECDPESLSSGPILEALHNAGAVDIVYDRAVILGDVDGDAIAARAMSKLRNRLRDKVAMLENVHIKVGDFSTDCGLGCAYDFGVRLIIDGVQYLSRLEDGTIIEFPLLPKGNMSAEDYNRYECGQYNQFKASCYKIVDDTPFAIDGLREFQMEREAEPEIATNASVIEINANDTYEGFPLTSVWSRLGLDMAEVKNVKYSDVYFKSVRGWRGLSLLLEGLKLSSDASIHIITSAFDEKKDKYAYEFRGNGLLDVVCDKIILGSSCYVEENDAKNICAVGLGRKLAHSITVGDKTFLVHARVSVDYSQEHLPHARLLEIEYVNGQGESRNARIAFDKGMDFIRYDNVVAHNSGERYRDRIKLFSEAIKRQLYYDYTLISLINDGPTTGGGE